MLSRILCKLTEQNARLVEIRKTEFAEKIFIPEWKGIENKKF
jgi:hypothetical protein